MARMTDQEIAALARRLATILEDTSGHGTMAWEMARTHLGQELYDALGDALGKPSRGVQFGHGNTQINTF